MFLLIRMEYSKMKRKTAYLGMIAAAAILLGYIESLLPLYIGVPGVKLGISNLATVFVLYYYGTKEAALVSAVRILVVGFLFGNLFSILFSLAGAALSLLVMAGVKRIRGFSVFGVSMAGGIAHNVGQLIVASFVVENFYILYYLPVLLISGMICGFLIGIASGAVIRRVSPESLNNM